MVKQPKRILVVDDEENARIGLSRLLAKEGFVVDCVANGFEALNYLRQQDVNLIESYIESMNLGAFEYLNKPVKVDELKSILKKIFKESSH